MGLYIPGLARRHVAVLRLRGVLGEASACRLAASMRCAFAADPDLLITDVGGLRGWDDSGQRQLADVAAYLAARGGQMVLNAVGVPLENLVSCCELGFRSGISGVAGTISECCCRSSTGC